MADNLEQELADYIAKEFTSPDTSIYHYTDEIGYSSICRNKYLLINPHTFLNKKNPVNKELQPAYKLIIKQLDNDNDLKYLVPKFKDFIREGIIYFTLSFSISRSILLPKKYGYFCLEFNPEMFKRFSNTERATLFGTVIYNSDNQERIIQEMFSIYKKYKNDNQSICILFEKLAIVIPLLKSSEHKNDSECRIVQAEIFDPTYGKRCTPFVTKKFPFELREILNVYKEPKINAQCFIRLISIYHKLFFQNRAH